MRKLWLPSIMFSFFLLAHTAFAQQQGGAAPGGVIQNNITGCDFSSGRLFANCIPNFIAHLIALVFSLLGLFFIGNVIYAGYQIAISGLTGDKEAGKRRLMWAIIGLIVAVCAFVILDLILSVVTDRL